MLLHSLNYAERSPRPTFLCFLLSAVCCFLSIYSSLSLSLPLSCGPTSLHPSFLLDQSDKLQSIASPCVASLPPPCLLARVALPFCSHPTP